MHPKAKEAVNTALALDKRLAEAHISLAALLMLNEWQWEKAEEEFKIGLELNPNYATGYHWYSELLLFTGRPEQAVEMISYASNLDPVSMAIMKDYGITLYYTRQYDKGIEKALSTLILDSNFIAVHRLLSLCYEGKELYDLALEENTKWGKLTRNILKTKLAEAHILAKAGNLKEAKSMIEELIAEHPLGHNDYRSVALVYVALGDHDKAFEWLDKSFAEGEEAISNLKVDPKLDPIRNDPRFETLVKRVGLPL